MRKRQYRPVTHDPLGTYSGNPSRSVPSPPAPPLLAQPSRSIAHHGAPDLASHTTSPSSPSRLTPSSDQYPLDFDQFNSASTAAWNTPADPSTFSNSNYTFPQYDQNDLYWQSFLPVESLATNQLYSNITPVDCAPFSDPSLFNRTNTTSLAAPQWPYSSQQQSLYLGNQAAYNAFNQSAIEPIPQSLEQPPVAIAPHLSTSADLNPGYVPFSSSSPLQSVTHNVQHRPYPSPAPSHSTPVVGPSGGAASIQGRQRIKPSTGTISRHRTNAGVQHAHPTKKEVAHAVKLAIRSSTHEPTPDEIPACWRCRRYKKQCDGPGECSNCMKGNFRVWPESLGCRRGCLEDFILELIPEGAAVILTKAAGAQPLALSWRATPNFNRKAMIELRLPSSDRLQRLSLKVQSVGMYGDEFISLFNIVARYQSVRRKQSPVLDSAIEILENACDIYHNFVSNDWPLDPASVQKATTLFSYHFHRMGRTFMAAALSGRRADWLPSFLSICLGVNAVIIMIDMAFALPSKWQQLLYPDIIKTAQFMREVFFPVVSDLLRAGTNGSKPFEMSCWSWVPDPATGELVRNPAGLKLVADDEPTFDGMGSLQEWYRQNMSMAALGKRWATATPFSDPTAPSITAMLGLFNYRLS